MRIAIAMTGNYQRAEFECSAFLIPSVLEFGVLFVDVEWLFQY